MRSEYNKFNFLNKKVRYYENIPEKIFINIMRNASVLVGNSSMGVLEAPLLKLPVVNIGLRQKDRQNAGNILFVGHNKKEIIKNFENIPNLNIDEFDLDNKVWKFGYESE